MIHLDVRNESSYKGVYRRDNLVRIAQRVCVGEGRRGPFELSLLFCDDPFIQELNRSYRRKDQPTDVLSFCQGAQVYHEAAVLGDIVISLETVSGRCGGDVVVMRDEVRLLFCHGLLHLLGYRHGGKAEEQRMQEKQAAYLGLPLEAAWRYA